ncbi:hypothetical protein GCM10007938_13030 [Vibrio zhanjiangensis]|uniref:Uncharacterized protein n=2 Tax=Vibrio zhanjiangensis TaxID=1046128 RepID=A0ABQ6EWT3_9VIBR|nr:hypothetical protein GCM10007938_13030 [Vibrio zhanjiangensis]
MMLSNIFNKGEYTKVSSEKVKVHLVGYIDKGSNQFNREVENVGRSFFKWGANELLNIATLFNTLGFENFKFAELEYVKPNLDSIRSMPSWPNPNSIRFFDDILVIKVSDYTEAQINLLCKDENGLSLTNIDSCSVTYNPQSIIFYVSRFRDGSSQKPIFDSKRMPFQDYKNINLKIDSTLELKNDDSQIVLPDIERKDGFMEINIQGHYSQDDFIDLYFKNDGKNYYHYSNTMRISIKKGNVDIYLTLPSNLFMNGLRIDPSVNVGTISQFSVRVFENDKK